MILDIVGGVGGFLTLIAALRMGLSYWSARTKRKLAPAPPLNPKWVKRNCKHLAPEPVEMRDGGEVLVWICTDPGCYAQLEPDDPAVVARKATDLKKALRADADLLRSDLDRMMGKLVADRDKATYVEVTPSLSAFSTAMLEVQTKAIRQAEEFAARTRREEERARERSVAKRNKAREYSKNGRNWSGKKQTKGYGWDW